MLFALHALYCSFCISILFFEVVHYDKNRSCKKELLQYGFKVVKISMKEQTVDFEKVEEEA